MDKDWSQGKEDMARVILSDFEYMWSCLKFETRSSKVIGYTFLKKEVDEFRRKLYHYANIHKSVKSNDKRRMNK
jgi:hypothetical protein